MYFFFLNQVFNIFIQNGENLDNKMRVIKVCDIYEIFKVNRMGGLQW